MTFCLSVLISTKTVTPGGGVLAMLLPQQIDNQPLAMCIGGVGSVVIDNAGRFARVMQEAIARHLLQQGGKAA